MVLVYETKTSGLRIFLCGVWWTEAQSRKIYYGSTGFSETSVNIYQMTNQRI